MKIAVNTRLLIKNKLEGIGWYTYETFKRITQEHPEHEFHFLFDRKPDKEFIFSSNIKPVVLHPQARHPLLWHLWFQFSVARYLKINGIDLFISPDGFIPLRAKTPTIAVIHDINFHHHPEGLPLTSRYYYRKYFPKFARRATKIVTVSEYSKNDIASSFNVDLSKIDVTLNGANTIFTPLTEEEKIDARLKYAKGNNYFVFVGALNPRKNVARLIQSFDIFLKTSNLNYSLVIVGEVMFMTEDIKEAISKMLHKESVVFTGRLQLDELRKVMGAATALTFVPYFEGFGIPLVEAMYCHVPIIASNRTSMPEVADDAAFYVDPFDVDSISKAMKLIATDSKLQEALVAKAEKRKVLFSWDNTASKLYESINEVLTITKKGNA